MGPRYPAEQNLQAVLHLVPGLLTKGCSRAGTAPGTQGQGGRGAGPPGASVADHGPPAPHAGVFRPAWPPRRRQTGCLCGRTARSLQTHAVYRESGTRAITSCSFRANCSGVHCALLAWAAPSSHLGTAGSGPPAPPQQQTHGRHFLPAPAAGPLPLPGFGTEAGGSNAPPESDPPAPRGAGEVREPLAQFCPCSFTRASSQSVNMPEK